MTDLAVLKILEKLIYIMFVWKCLVWNTNVFEKLCTLFLQLYLKNSVWCYCFCLHHLQCPTICLPSEGIDTNFTMPSSTCFKSSLFSLCIWIFCFGFFFVFFFFTYTSNSFNYLSMEFFNLSLLLIGLFIILCKC